MQNIQLTNNITLYQVTQFDYIWLQRVYQIFIIELLTALWNRAVQWSASMLLTTRLSCHFEGYPLYHYLYQHIPTHFMMVLFVPIETSLIGTYLVPVRATAIL